MGAPPRYRFTELRTPLRAARPGRPARPSQPRTAFHRPPARPEEEFTRFLLYDLEPPFPPRTGRTPSADGHHGAGPRTPGGSFPPSPARLLFRGPVPPPRCDEARILPRRREVTTGFGRAGTWFAPSERFDHPGPPNLINLRHVPFLPPTPAIGGAGIAGARHGSRFFAQARRHVMQRQ